MQLYNDVIKTMSKSDKKKYNIMMNLPTIKEEKESFNTCKNCFLNNFDIVDDSLYICINCGCEIMHLLNSDKHVDMSRIILITKQVYNRGDNFEKVIKDFLKFQEVDKEIILSIQNEFEVLVSKFEKERYGKNFINLKYTLYRLLLKKKIIIRDGYFKENFKDKACLFLDKYI